MHIVIIRWKKKMPKMQTQKHFHIPIFSPPSTDPTHFHITQLRREKIMLDERDSTNSIFREQPTLHKDLSFDLYC